MSRLNALLRRRRVALIVLIILTVLVVWFVRSVQHKQPVDNARGGPGPGGAGGPIAVTVAQVSSGDIEVRIPALGTVTPLATVTVRTQISGVLQKIAFTEGQRVQQGDFLAQVDPRPYQAALEQTRGNLRRDQALLADAKLDLTRYQGLISEDSIAQQQLDTQRALVDQYGGTVEADQAAVKTAALNLQYTHIVAPVTGRVGLRQVDQGNYVTPGDGNGIVVITELQPITAIFSIPEDNVPAVMRRLQAGTALAAEAYDRANTNKLAVGKVSTADNQIDTTTGTIKLRALFDNQDGALFPNQFVNIELLQDVLHDQIIMPSAAVHRGAPNGVAATFVYRVNPDHTVSVQTVKLGIADGERVAVTEGIAAGDTVVTEGGDRLRDGAPVTLPGPVTTAPRNANAGSQSGKHGGRSKHGMRSQRP